MYHKLKIKMIMITSIIYHNNIIQSLSVKVSVLTIKNLCVVYKWFVSVIFDLDEKKNVCYKPKTIFIAAWEHTQSVVNTITIILQEGIELDRPLIEDSLWQYNMTKQFGVSEIWTFSVHTLDHHQAALNECVWYRSQSIRRQC